MPKSYTEKEHKRQPRQPHYEQLPRDLHQYMTDYVQLCVKLLESEKKESGNATLWVHSYYNGPDLMQNFLWEENPEKKLEYADRLLTDSKVLTYMDDPVTKQLGHLGEKLALGMKCFIYPNLDTVAERSLRRIFNDRELARICTETLSAAQDELAREKQKGEIMFNHTDVVHRFGDILQAIRERDFEKAHEEAQTGIDMGMIYADKYLSARKAVQFFSIVEFLLDQRLKGHLFGAAGPDTKRSL